MNLEFYTALEEYDFLCGAARLQTCRTVVEIGMGYGRTAHSLVRLMPNLERYTVIDLPETWALGRGYLSRVAPDVLDRIDFLDFRDVTGQSRLRPDLAINVDGFHAMTKATLDAYQVNVLRNSHYVYLKNSVCKYLPSRIGLKTQVPSDLFENGYMTEVADIFNDDEMQQYRALYVERHRPQAVFSVVAEQSSESFGFFHHVLYEK